MTCSPLFIANGDFSPKMIHHRAGDEIRYRCKDGFYPETWEAIVKYTSTGWIPAAHLAVNLFTSLIPIILKLLFETCADRAILLGNI